MRVACLLVPDLPLRAELRARPEQAGRPLAITHTAGDRAEIVAASPEAERCGVQPGRTLPQARATCPEIEIRVASPVLERAAREALLDVALSLSPRAELSTRGAGLFMAEGVVFVDANGIDALYESENRFASLLFARAERAGLPGFVGLASSRGVARLAARQLALTARLARSKTPETIRVLDPDRELAFLAPLPLDLLDPDDRTAEALTRFGIRCVRDLLRIPPRDLAARIGPDLLGLVARARGEEKEPPLSEPPEPILEEGQDLEVPMDRLEPLVSTLRDLVSRLTERLILRGLGCVTLRLTLRIEGGGRIARRIGVASPCQDEQVLERLLQLAIERDPPPAPVEGLSLCAEGRPLRREQLDLFLPRGPSPSALDRTLAELVSLCGEARVGSPRIVDDHRPDTFSLAPFRPPRRPSATPSRTLPPLRRRARLALRALRPPISADVRLSEGRPAHLDSAISRGRILRAAGPWRATGRWWSSAHRFAFDHYDVQVEDDSLLRVRFDWVRKEWQVDGVYD
jgi:protein ImuB